MDLGPLPPGWAMAKTVEGQTYFIEEATMQTTWIDPRTNRPTPGTQTVRESVSSSGENKELFLDQRPHLYLHYHDLLVAGERAPPRWRKGRLPRYAPA